MNRDRNIFDLMGSHIDVFDGQLGADGIMQGFRNADAARLGERLEPRCDIDAVAEQIAVLIDHISDGQANAVGHLAADGIGLIAHAQGFLNVDRTPQRIDRARKFSEHAIAGGFEHAPARLLN